MTYGWTIEYIDGLTWPNIKKMLRQIAERPPAGIILSEVFKKRTEPTSSQIGGIGLPFKKGKILRRK